jgi:predicted GNAT superfamily acetyltransferase
MVGLADTGLEIAELHSVADLNELEALLAGVWETSDLPPISGQTLRALSHAGNYVAGASRGGVLVAGLVGFFGRTPTGDLLLHSHILGVKPDAHAQGIGHALKQHQRNWALERGIETVTWTFDPLVRRNAYFNLAKLGGEVGAYHTDFYGNMADAINAGDETDRLEVCWRVRSARAVQMDADNLLAAGAVVTLRVAPDGGPAHEPGIGPIQLCQVPEDIVALRQAQPQLAAKWRVALRRALATPLANGYRVAGMTRDGWYVLEGRR